jgi:SAM-dependent methyltransferase
MLRRRVGPLDDLRVIELGGAVSYRALALAKWHRARVVISDYSPVGLARTDAIFAANQCPVTTIFGDFFALDLGDERFDLVMHFGVLEHFTDVAGVLRVCAKLLEPGGTIFFTMPNMEAWGASFWRRWAMKNWNTHIFHPDDAIASACDSLGLRLAVAFHAGSPLFKVGAWERRTVGTRILTSAQHTANRIGKVVPIYDRGLRRVSRYRGFVVRALPSPQDRPQ